MKLLQTLSSAQDQSVNFVFDNGQEARYVNRGDEKLLVYLSSHSGCNQACRMCHLTQTKQTEFVPTTIDEYVTQAEHVLHHYAQQVEFHQIERVKHLNFNFMARGEPMLNPNVMSARLFGELTQRLNRAAVMTPVALGQFNISTIMPAQAVYPDNKIAEVFWMDAYPSRVSIFYSLYSLDPAFRKRWLPKAMDPMEALELLARWQNRSPSYRLVTLHWALIEGENDTLEQAQAIVDAVRDVGLKAKFNLVRYNPYSELQGKEPPDITIQKYFELMSSGMTAPGSRIVPRVGPDVSAACGQFINLHKA